MEADSHIQEPQGLWPSRVVIENLRPQIDGGRFPIKRTVGEEVVVTAEIHADGHDTLAAVLRYRHGEDPSWQEVPMASKGNDLWKAAFAITAIGRYRYTVEGWVDRFSSWRRGFEKKVQAGQDIGVDLLAGAVLVDEAGRRTAGTDGRWLAGRAEALRSTQTDLSERVRLALDPALASLMDRYPDRSVTTRYEPLLEVTADRERARFGAWYEMFPRSASPEPGRHGTLRDVEARLPYVASMGFDVLYLPPLHPIGHTHRKGRNNFADLGPGDPGSPWAIGSEEGGHTSIHPELGTLEDFRRLVGRARDHEIEIALDIPFQCSPDHPWVQEYPEWFHHRPDGTIQYAENPPKKYQDIYPLNFETPAWRGLYEELKGIFLFWIGQGVRIFRVDNPHTKPYGFWEWVIGEIKAVHPDVIFLAEAFTRPKAMARLAKVGFSQSYTYFTWRNTRSEITEYFTELTGTDLREYFRPNLWPSTPDILPENLQAGGRAAFAARLVLAATLGASYGIFGPAYELLENRPLAPGREEFLDSEKYEIRHWDIERPESLRGLIARVNRLRRESPALQTNSGLRFIPTDKDQIIAYVKRTPDSSDIVLTVVNLDFFNVQSGWLDLPLEDLEIDPRQSYQVHDLLGDARYFWQGRKNYVELDPRIMPAHVFKLRRRVRTERDFDYFS
jgi:starch synthase (maltosyl-transferring)